MKLYYSIIILIFLFLSCENDEIETPEDEGGKPNIEINGIMTVFEPSASVTLKNEYWVLEKMTGYENPSDEFIKKSKIIFSSKIEFMEDGMLPFGGFGTINSFQGNYISEDDSLKIRNLKTSLIAGSKELSDFEKKLRSYLRSSCSYSIENENLIIHTEENDFIQYKRKYWEGFKYLFLNDTTIGSNIYDIVQDAENTIWFATNKGLLSYKNSTWSSHNSKNGFIDLTCFKLFIDKDSMLWVGTWGNGIYSYSSGNWEQHLSNAGPDNNIVYDIDETENGILWIGTKEGLNKFDKDTFSVYTHDSSEPHKHYEEVEIDENGIIWVIGVRGNLFQFDGKRWKTISESSGISSDQALTLFHDSNNKMWISTNEGLDYSYNGQIYNLGKQLNLAWVTLIYEDKSGNIWFDNKYMKNDLNPEYNLKTIEGLRIDGLTSILNDNNGSYWFGGFNSPLEFFINKKNKLN